MRTVKNTKASAQSIRSAAFEALETRSLMSVSLDPATHVLTATGTAGNDVIVVDMGGGNVKVNDNGTLKSFAAGTVSYIVLRGLAGSDSLRLTDAVTKGATLNGGTGNDYLRGGSANDFLNGDEDNDTLDGGNGNDVMSGGTGIDAVDYSARTTAVNVSLDNIANDGKAGETDNVKSDIENVYGGSGNDTLSGGSTNASLFGYAGNDTINGGSGLGTSYLYGGDGNDTIYPHGFQTVTYAGNGDDYVNSYCSGTTWTYGEAGNDTLWGGYGQNVLYGGDGNDTVRGYGSQTNWLYGDNGDDKVYGGGTTLNYVFGGAGNDQLFGGQGQDIMHGDDGDDILVTVGGGQSDWAYGDNGADTFWCDAEISEKTPDLNLIEGLLGMGHRVASFSNGASRELLGQNIADPNAYDNRSNYTPGSSNFSTSPLFAAGGPKEDDIVQGQVGDCYFLSGLSGTAKTNPFRIKQSVVDFGDGTFGVQFKSGGNNFFYRVDADLPVYVGTTTLYYANKGTGNSIWVPIMEKAFTMFRSGASTYNSIHGGNQTEPFYALGGSSIGSVWGTNASDTLNKINAALAAGKQVSAGTPSGAPTNGCPCVGWHSYTVDHVNYQQFYLPFIGWLNIPVSITLRNPWGYDGAGSDANTSDGYVTATADQFFNYFNSADAAFV